MVTTALSFPRIDGMSDPDSPGPRSAQELFDSVRSWFRSRARKLVGGTDVSESDLVNETMATMGRRLFASPETFKLASDVEMKQALHRLAKEAERRRAELPPMDLSALAEELVDHEQPGDALLVWEFIEHLQAQDPQKARLLELRAFGGFTHEQIASDLGVSLNTVTRQLAGLRERYTAWLGEKRGSDDS